MAYTTIACVSFVPEPDPANPGQLITTTLSYEAQIDLAQIITITEYFTPGTSGTLQPGRSLHDHGSPRVHTDCFLDADDNVVKVNEPEVIRQLEVEPQFRQLIQQGLRAVIDWEQGTAHEDFDVPGVIASGKTGTAEFCDEYPQCLDREGRVKTSHAWFTAYAPSFNPEIVTVVFVYGGGEGSRVAVPVTNKILRYYFNIPDEVDEADEEPPTELEETDSRPPTDTIFTVRLLGTDRWDQDGANVSGYVLDELGQGISNVAIDIIMGDNIAAQIASGPTGNRGQRLSTDYSR